MPKPTALEMLSRVMNPGASWLLSSLVGAKDAKPVLYLPPSRPCPQVDEHYVPLCAIACRQVHGDKVRFPGFLLVFFASHE